MAIISLIEDFGLVGFETLAVEDKNSMLNLTRLIDKATGYIFIPRPTVAGTAEVPPNVTPSARPNTYALFTTASGPTRGPVSDVRDVQERWIDAKDAYDAFERQQWRKEGEAFRSPAVGQETNKENVDQQGGVRKRGI
jgi:hypothetical protein